VGKSKDGDPRAAFAILEGASAGVQARIERVEYDAERVAREVAELPAEYGEMLLRAA
jgi:diadenosine tetraphosphatase ApaH/serine/threonine PP2A family protein phosphatase